MGRKVENRVGKTFGNLFVLEQVPSPSTKYCVWKCRCPCGKTTIVRSSALIRGQKSCGMCEDDVLLGPEHAPVPVYSTIRKCNVCSKPLPPNRYFNHTECVVDVDTYSLDMTQDYGYFHGR